MITNRLFVISALLNLILLGFFGYVLFSSPEPYKGQWKPSSQAAGVALPPSSEAASVEKSDPANTAKPYPDQVEAKTPPAKVYSDQVNSPLEGAHPVEIQTSSSASASVRAQDGNRWQSTASSGSGPAPLSPGQQFFDPSEGPPLEVVAPTAPYKVPLALADPGPDIQLTDQQETQLNSLRRQFAQAVGSSNQNPASPDYIQRWRDAQQESDFRFWQLFGTEALFARQMQARLHPASAAP